MMKLVSLISELTIFIGEYDKSLMDITSQIIEIAKALSKEDREILLLLAGEDKELFRGALKKILRLKNTIMAGNELIWEKMKREDSQTFEYFLKELEDQKQINILRKQLMS